MGNSLPNLMFGKMTIIAKTDWYFLLNLYSNTFLIKIIIIMKLRRQKWHRRDNDKLDSSNIFIFFSCRAFGVLLWEVFSFGQLPYEDLTNCEVMAKVMNGHRLGQPKLCPIQLWVFLNYRGYYWIWSL